MACRGRLGKESLAENPMLPFTNEYDALIHQNNVDEALRIATGKLQGRSEIAVTLRDIGLLQFLNHQEDPEPYDSPDYFLGASVFLQPDDADLRFWHGYVHEIRTASNDYSISQYQCGLEISLNHPYCLLALAGNTNTDKTRQAKLLDQLLAVQPNHIRALMQKAELAASEGEVAVATRIFSRVIDADPYEETNFGFMNKYVNHVLTAHARATSEKAKAAGRLRQLTGHS
jgi:hypothetical protein